MSRICRTSHKRFKIDEMFKQTTSRKVDSLLSVYRTKPSGLTPGSTMTLKRDSMHKFGMRQGLVHHSSAMSEGSDKFSKMSRKCFDDLERKVDGTW